MINPKLLTGILLIIYFLSGCASSPALKSSSQNPGKKITFAKNENFVVLITQKGDSLESLAEKHLGSKEKAWVIADFNDISKIVPQREIVIPLKNFNPVQVYSDGYRTIPILCYHRFGNSHTKLSVSEKKFRQQMQYLKDQNFHVIHMRDVYEFIAGRKSLPKKSVVITIDDGYRSTYEIAYPILQKFNFPATLFLYTDFTGAGDAINWKQGVEMYKSGLMDIQPHSKSHPNMSLRNENESHESYKKRIFREVDEPSDKIRRKIGAPLHTFAYPYGDTNNMIIDHLVDKQYQLGVTVQPGSNPSFAHPYMLRRTMIFGDHSIKDFEKALTVFKKMSLK